MADRRWMGVMEDGGVRMVCVCVVVVVVGGPARWRIRTRECARDDGLRCTCAHPAMR
jgi:NaMN:DMB phosphoribosyltransferase